MVSLDPGIWVTALLMIFVYSAMWKQNRFFKFAEHTLVAVSTGFVVVMSVKTLQSMVVGQFMRGELVWGFVVVFGLLIYARFSKNYLWLSRWPTALIVGIATAVTVSTTVNANILAQIRGVALPLFGPNLWKAFSNWVAGIGVISVLAYFLFTMKGIQEARSIKGLVKVGRYVMIIAVGAAFGSTFVSYVIMLLERILFLLSSWLGLV